ncbi:hypothetical protein GBAR_LOCUS15591, partial [Geodia barretti]
MSSSLTPLETHDKSWNLWPECSLPLHNNKVHEAFIQVQGQMVKKEWAHVLGGRGVPA